MVVSCPKGPVKPKTADMILFTGAEASASANASPPANASPRPAARPDRIRTVFLFTDGQATTGVTNSARLKGILNLMLENSIRPTIHCFGFGHHYDAECLEAVAEAGQGQSAFIEDAESTPAALATALGGIMSIVAQNVEVTFTPKVGINCHIACSSGGRCCDITNIVAQPDFGQCHCTSKASCLPHCAHCDSMVRHSVT